MTGTIVEHVSLVDPDRPHWGQSDSPRPVPLTLWLPAGDGPHPVVLLSHGTGGAARDLARLAGALAADGFAAGGVDHHGDTYLQPYDPRGPGLWWERARDLSLALTYVLDTYPT